MATDFEQIAASYVRLYYLGEERRARLRQRRNPYNFQMTPGDLRCMHVFYICPMRESRRMALASIPFSYRAIAYKLAKHHRLPNIDWEGLPFQTNRSPLYLYRLRAPCAALPVREVRVHEFHEVGSHTLFLTSVEHESVAHKVEGIQLFTSV